MASAKETYRKLVRLREKRARLDRRISNLERQLNGKRYTWGNCSYHHNRK